MWNYEISKNEAEMITGYKELLNEIKKDIKEGGKITPENQKTADKYIEVFENKYNYTIDKIKDLNEELVKAGLA